MGITGRMLLGLEQRIEVPEARLYVIVGGHLLKAHLREDLAELGAHLQSSRQVSTHCKRQWPKHDLVFGLRDVSLISLIKVAFKLGHSLKLILSGSICDHGEVAADEWSSVNATLKSVMEEC